MSSPVTTNILFFEKDQSVGGWKSDYLPPIGSTVWLDYAETAEGFKKTAPYKVLSVDCHHGFVRVHVEYDYHRATSQSA